MKTNLFFLALLTSTALVSLNAYAIDYTSFEEAVEASAGEYTFESDETTGKIINITEEMIINGNGYTLTGESLSINAADKTITFNDLNFADMTNAGEYGGAVANSATGLLAFTGNTSFTNNTADFGGAISNVLGNVSFDGENRFKDNTANENGGAIYNTGSSNEDEEQYEFKISGTSYFENNIAANSGGAVFNNGEMTIIGKTLFSYNRADESEDGLGGGAVYNGKNLTVSGDNVIFRENVSNSQGGAISNIANAQDATIVIDVGSITFEGNVANRNGGAIYNLSEDDSLAKIILSGRSVFSNNFSVEASGGAIAIMNGELEINNTAVFNGNHAVNEGGAVYNQGKIIVDGDISFSNNKSESMSAGAVMNLGEFTVNGNSSFEGNEAATAGGALWSNKDINLNGSVSFSKNEAGTDGGAVYVDAGTLNILKDSSFTDNTAGGLGGAIFNNSESVINFEGKADFSGNKAGEKLNDIHNNGMINIAENGAISLDGGISGSGTITFESGSSLTAKGGTTTISNAILNKGADLTLIIENGYTGSEISILGEGGSLDNEFKLNDNFLFNLKETDTAGTYAVSRKTSEEFKDMLGASDNQAEAIEAMVYGRSKDEADPFNAVADAVSALLQSGSGQGLDAVTAWGPEVANLVQQQQTDTTNQVFSAVGSRLSGGTVSGRRGIASGDNPLSGITVWAQGLYNKANFDGVKGSKGWDSETYGLAVGLEGKVVPSVKLGAGYAYGKTSIDGFYRITDVYTHTGMLYSEYKPNNWFVNGIASYSWSDYREKKNVAGYTIKAKYDVDTMGLQAMTGYEFKIQQGINIVPEAGVRYLRLDQKGYKDSTNVRIDPEDGNIFTGVVGTKVSQSWIINCKTVVTPEIRVAATYDFERSGADSYVSLPNGSAYEVKGQSMNRFGVEVGAGVTAEVKKNVELSASYEGRFRSHYQDHSGLFGAKYKF